MKKYLVFTENNARFHYALEEVPDAYGGLPFIENPDLSLVKGLPPHHWKLVDGKVLPMTELERAERDSHIAAHGAINHFIEKQIQGPIPDLMESNARFDLRTFIIGSAVLMLVIAVVLASVRFLSF